MNNPHKNARTTVYMRELIVTRRGAGESVSSIGVALGLSTRTVHKWLARFAAHGPAGLENRSSRPHTNPYAFTAGWEAVIAKLRRYRMTALEIAQTLGFARSTVSAVLKRLKLNRLGRLDPPEPVRRYERKNPGDLIHLDIKKLRRFNRIGHRMSGDRSLGKSKNMAWDYVHICIDDHARVAYAEVLEDEKGKTCADFLARAVKWFADHGVTVRRVMSDNGVGYISNIFAETAQALGMRHIRTRPYTPQTNGKAERFIQTMLREWA